MASLVVYKTQKKPYKAISDTAAWTNFAKTGNPNAPGLPNWLAYTPENGATMMFDVHSAVVNHPDEDILKIANAPKP